MNEQDYLRELDMALDQIDTHPDLIPELFSLLRRSGSESRFLSLFVRRLTFLQQYGRNAILYNKEYERINETIYSMHIDTGDKNIRILYGFRNDGTVLLLAFHERAGKKATDYTSHIPEATRRLNELED